MLANHSSIGGALAPHFLATFYRSRFAYSSDTPGKTRLFRDMLSAANHEKHDWQISLSFENFQERYDPKAFLDYFDGFYALVQERHSAKYVVCKELDTFKYAKQLNEYYRGRCQFIYLYRDPRDYCASWMHVPLGYKDPVKAAQNWQQEQTQCLQVSAINGASVFSLSYESLIADPMDSVNRILDLLNLAREPSCYTPEKKEGRSQETRYIYFKNLNKPVMPDNTGKFAECFDNLTTYQIEKVALPIMVELGYKPLTRHTKLKDTIFSVYRTLQLRNPERFKAPHADDYSLQLLKDWHEFQKRIKAQSG